MRNAIVEAATTTAGRDEGKVAVARHMPDIIWHMLTNNEECRTQDRQLTQRKYKKMEDAITAS